MFLGNCDVCRASATTACGLCGLISYCNANHMREHRVIHRTECRNLYRLQKELNNEWITAQSRPIGSEIELYLGLISSYRKYIHRLMSIGSMKALNLALTHAENLNETFPGFLDENFDNEIPLLMILLGKDKDAYEFVTIARFNTAMHYMNAGFLRAAKTPAHIDRMALLYAPEKEEQNPFIEKSAPILHSIELDGAIEGPVPAYHLLALMLVKIRHMNDLKNLQNAQLLEILLNYDVVDIVKEFLPQTAIIRNSIYLRRLVRDHTELIKSIQDQIQQLFDTIQAKESDFFVKFLELGAGPCRDEYSTPRIYLNAFRQTDRAIDTIERLMNH